MEAFTQAISSLFSGVDSDGFKELLLAIGRIFANFDARSSMDLYINTITQLLDKYSSIWNPIWQEITTYLEAWFGF